MSDCKCQHNNHSHFLIYYFIWMIMMWNMMDCGGGQARMDSKIRSLESDVSSLKSQVSSLQYRR